MLLSKFFPKIKHFYATIFFGYKTKVFAFQNNPKYPDPSYKMDLDFGDILEGKTHLIEEFHMTV